VDADALDDQHLVLDDDIAFGVSAQSALARIDPARLQRATQGARESTGGRGDHVVERGGVLGILACRGPIVLAHLVVGAENYRLGFGRNMSRSDRPAFADDPDPRDILGPIHCRLD
jgi:hypothetical protein